MAPDICSHARAIATDGLDTKLQRIGGNPIHGVCKLVCSNYQIRGKPILVGATNGQQVCKMYVLLDVVHKDKRGTFIDGNGGRVERVRMR